MMLTRGVCRVIPRFLAIASAEVTTPLAIRPGPPSFSLAKTKIVSPRAICLPPYIVFCAMNAKHLRRRIANLRFDRKRHTSHLARLIPWPFMAPEPKREQDQSPRTAVLVVATLRTTTGKIGIAAKGFCCPACLGAEVV